MRGSACGLDFGTSNSTLGFIGPRDLPRLAELEGGSTAIPSAMFFSFEDDEIYYGHAAISEYISGADGRVMRALKSVLGSSLIDDETRIKAQKISFTEIIGMFIGELKVRGEAVAGAWFRSVVAGRPVRFVDDDDEADRAAQGQLEAVLRGQGFEQIAFQYEPIAAALDFEQRIADERLVLVVDIGGGTSDFTLIRLSPERARNADRTSDILATAGVHIGGTDFDRLLSMSQIMPLLGSGGLTVSGNRPIPIGPYYDLAVWHRINRLYTRQAMSELRVTRREAAEREKFDKLVAVIEGRHGHRLATHVEDAKIELSAHLLSAFRFQADDVVIQADVSRQSFEHAVADAVGRIHGAISGILNAAGVKPAQVRNLVMTGGSTQIPVVRNGLDRMFPEAEFVETDAFGSVGLGLALEAKRRFGG